MPKRASPTNRKSPRSMRRSLRVDQGARFSGAFDTAENYVSWASLPGQVEGTASISAAVRADFHTSNDEDAEFVGERTAQEQEEAEMRARQMELNDKEGRVAEKEDVIETYEAQLDMAIRARQRWVDQRNEYDEVLKELKMKLDEAEERIQAANATKDAYKSRGSMRGMLILGGGKVAANKEVRVSSLLTDMTGVDVSNEDDETDEPAGDEEDQDESTCWRSFRRSLLRFKNVILSLILFFNFFADDVKKVSSMYGGTLVPLFSFLQATVALGSITILLHAPLLITQLVTHDIQGARVCGLFDQACWLLYGGFDHGLGIFYLLVALGSALATLVFSVYNWGKFDRRYQVIRLRNELEGKRRFAKVALAAWDFRLSTEKEKATYGGRVSRALEALKVEDDTEAELRALTPAQKKKIFYWRIVGTVLFLFTLVLGWSLIAVSTYYQNAVDSYFGDLSGGNQTVKTVILFIPAIVVNLLGELAPKTIELITDMERWPPGVKEKQLTWRLYVSNIVNVVIYVALYYELISAKSLFSKHGDPLVLLDTEQYTCKEDQAAVSLLVLSVSDIFVGSFLQLATKVFWPAFKKYVLKTRKYKAEFKVADGVVMHSVSLSLVWMSLVLSPYAALFFPVAMAVRYVTSRVCLSFADIESSGATEAMSVGVLIMRLFCFTSVVYVFFAFLILCVPLPRSSDCGPYPSNTRGLDIVGLNILDVFNPMAIALLGLCVAFMLAVLFKNNRVQALQGALKETVARTARMASQMQRDLRRAIGQNAVLRSRMEKASRRREV